MAFFDVIFKRANGANGLRADLTNLTKEVDWLRERFEEQEKTRSGYIEQLQAATRSLSSIDGELKGIRLEIQRNSTKLEENAAFLYRLNERTEAVAKRGHDLADEMSTSVIVLQMVCEKVGVKYPDRRR